MGTDDYIAAIGATATSFAPRNTALCQGQLMPIQQNQALFALLADFYGGDMRVSFALPDLRGAAPFSFGPAASGVTWEIGERPADLTGYDWPAWPARAGEGDTATVPVAAGPAGVALNWAIALYGYWPERP
jgi:microcystin-dependent protein